MKINFCDLKRQYGLISKDIKRSIEKVFSHGKFINGPEIQELEKKLSKFVGAKFAVGVSSGTIALIASLMALEIKEGDYVITTPFTFPANVEAIYFLKAKPIFIDIDSGTFNLDPVKLEEFLNNLEDPLTNLKIPIKKIKAIIVVNLFGQIADYGSIKEKLIMGRLDIPVIEDAAQSMGSEYLGKKSGSFGDLAITSFFPSKPLGGYGDSGMIFTNNKELFEKLKMIRNHGQRKKYSCEILGSNMRMDSIQAGMIIEKLKLLKTEISKRQEVVKKYKESLGELKERKYIEFQKIIPGNLSSYAQFSIKVERRDELLKHLENVGVPYAIHYPMPIYRQKAFLKQEYSESLCSVAENISKSIISLPMDPYKTNKEIEYISGVVKNFYLKKDK